ncbi:hypothetical protein P8452_47109 [Trifolium repens]|nr:hypothetical protein P8452_47109 [Trifolium repens]
MEEWVNDKWIWHIKWRRIESIVVVPQVWGSWARRRRILPSGVASWCPWCKGQVESENHLLVTCPLAWAVWALVILSVVLSTLASMYESFLKGCRKGKQGSKEKLKDIHLYLISTATTRSIRRSNSD